MATIQTQIRLVDNMSKPLNKIINSINKVVSSVNNFETSATKAMNSTAINASKVVQSQAQIGQNLIKSTSQMESFANTSRTAISPQQQISSQVKQMSNDINNATNSQNQFNNALNNGSGASSSLLGNLKGLVTGYAILKGAKSAMDISDNLSQTNARLGLIKDSTNTIESLQAKMRASALRTRSSYDSLADTVAKLSLQAKKAFSGNDQTIKFAENLNKIFAISGTSIQGAESTMYNLTQALSSGVLRGQDFNIVMQNAPMILEKVAESMNVPMGTLRELASKGKLTADVVKNAILSASDDIDAKFSQMPATWSQLFTMARDGVVQALQPVFEILGGIATWIADNWSTVAPIFNAVAVALLFVGTALAVVWLWTTLLNAVLTASPIGWVIMIIGVLIGIIYYWIQAVGGVRVAWLIALHYIQVAIEGFRLFFTKVSIAIRNIADQIVLAGILLKNGFANAMGQMKADVLNILQAMVNGAIAIINALIEAVNVIPGVNIKTIEAVTFGTEATVKHEAEKQARAHAFKEQQALAAENKLSRQQEYKNLEKQFNEASAQRLQNIADAKAQANASKSQTQLNMAGGGGGAGAGAGGGGGKMGDDVGKIKDAVTKGEEDLKYLRDIAEREVINRFTTAEINVDMGGITQNVSKNADLDGIISYLEDTLYASMKTAAEGV